MVRVPVTFSFSVSTGHYLSELSFRYVVIGGKAIFYIFTGRCCVLRTCALLPGHFSLFIFSCAGRSGRTGEPAKDIVDVSAGWLTHSRTLQYRTRWLFAVA